MPRNIEVNHCPSCSSTRLRKTRRRDRPDIQFSIRGALQCEDCGTRFIPASGVFVRVFAGALFGVFVCGVGWEFMVVPIRGMLRDAVSFIGMFDLFLGVLAIYYCACATRVILRSGVPRIMDTCQGRMAKTHGPCA